MITFNGIGDLVADELKISFRSLSIVLFIAGVAVAAVYVAFCYLLYYQHIYLVL